MLFDISRTPWRRGDNQLCLSCPAVVPGIHEFLVTIKDVDGRDKPGHDEREKERCRTAYSGSNLVPGILSHSRLAQLR